MEMRKRETERQRAEDRKRKGGKGEGEGEGEGGTLWVYIYVHELTEFCFPYLPTHLPTATHIQDLYILLHGLDTDLTLPPYLYFLSLLLLPPQKSPFFHFGYPEQASNFNCVCSDGSIDLFCLYISRQWLDLDFRLGGSRRKTPVKLNQVDFCFLR